MPYAPHGPRLYYERQDSGEPLLFVTGFVISSAVFEPVLPLYAEHFDVITSTIACRGAHQAAAPDLDARARGHPARLLDALEVESAHVYGLSFSAIVAQSWRSAFRSGCAVWSSGVRRRAGRGGHPLPARAPGDPRPRRRRRAR